MLTHLHKLKVSHFAIKQTSVKTDFIGIELPDIAGLTMRGGYSTAALCRPGEVGSVCHQCCAQGNNCNQNWVQTQLDTLEEWLNFDV